MTTAGAVLGSTGSIGTQTLDIVRADPARFRVCALGAASSVDKLVAQAEEFRPDVVAIVDDTRAATLAERLPDGTELLVGPKARVTGELYETLKRHRGELCRLLRSTETVQ